MPRFYSQIIDNCLLFFFLAALLEVCQFYQTFQRSSFLISLIFSSVFLFSISLIAVFYNFLSSASFVCILFFFIEVLEVKGQITDLRLISNEFIWCYTFLSQHYFSCVPHFNCIFIFIQFNVLLDLPRDFLFDPQIVFCNVIIEIYFTQYNWPQNNVGVRGAKPQSKIHM